MPPDAITKSAFLAGLECPTMGWRLLRDDKDGGPPSPSDLFRMQEGQEVHERARSLHPDGRFGGTLEQTTELLGDADLGVIFEAAFRAGSIAARADWIRRAGEGWVVGEIKSSLHDDEEAKEEHLDDLAYTAMVLRRAGLRVEGAELALLNRDWRLGDPGDDLFVVSDWTVEVLDRTDEFDRLADQLARDLLQNTPPEAVWKLACKDCEYFADRCLGTGLRRPVTRLPRLSEDRLQELVQAGHTEIASIPPTIRLTPTQAAVAEAIRSGEPVIDRDHLQEGLEAIVHPVGYLDFETVKTAIPALPGVAPHEQVVTQYSLHIRDESGGPLTHVDRLADHVSDGRRELAERLLAETSTLRSVVVYSSFERTVIRGLAGRFPDLAECLVALDNRLVDLLPVVRGGYVHPDFNGGFGLKAVLPVVCPGLGYEGLTIADGGAAITAFARLMRGEVPAGEVKGLRRALLEYCRMDTLAMVELHRFLVDL